MNMESSELFSHIDEVNLSYRATRSDIRKLCDEALKNQAASIVIPPSYIEVAASYLGEQLPAGTVISYPYGFDTSAAKGFLASDAVTNGAGEIACVVNGGWIFDEKWKDIEAETAFLKKACGERTLKMLVNFNGLTRDQKVLTAEAIESGGADMIGLLFDGSSSSAPLSDLVLLRDLNNFALSILVCGGIRKTETVQQLLNLGADRVALVRDLS